MALKGEPFKKLGGLFKQMLPTVLAGISGPAAPMVFAAARTLLGDKAGDEGGLAEAVEQALGTPDGRAKLKELELAAKKLEADTGVRFAELEVQDVSSARLHGVEMSRQGDRTTKHLAWLLVGAFIVVSITIIVAELLGLGAGESTLVGSIIGYLLGEAKQVTTYYFGSSRGSKEKTDLLAGK
jgi:hypothetical protein